MKIKNLSLVIKVAVPAVFGLLALFAISFLAYELLTKTAATAKQIAEVNVKATVTLANISDEFSTINTTIYQILVKKAANKAYDANKDINAVKTDLDTLTQEASEYFSRSPSEDLAYVLKEIKGSKEEKIAGYADALTVIQAMLEIDFTGAVNAIEPFTEKYRKVKERLQKIRLDSYNDAQETSGKMFRTIEKNLSRGEVLLAVLIVFVFIMNYILGKDLINSIKNIASVTNSLAKGNTAMDLEELTRKDELGVVVESLKEFKINIVRIGELQKNQEQMRIESEAARKNAMKEMANNFESGVQGVIATVASASADLQHTAEGMKSTMAKTSKQSSTAASASEQTSTNVTSVSAAVEEMSLSVKEIAGQVAKSSELVTETVARTQQADKTVQILTSAVMKISNIVELINGISGQINLLALNATIESARAGEAGKGFAVVASEVKTLAGETSKATEDIAKQIESVKGASAEVVHVLKDIQKSIANINQYSSSIASAVEEQSAVTTEISGNMQRAALGVQNISTNIVQVTEGVSNADHQAGKVLDASQMLSRQSELLSEQVEHFLSGIRV